jgi:predicted ATP-grasp superfamily ATP-dependent carboligase
MRGMGDEDGKGSSDMAQGTEASQGRRIFVCEYLSASGGEPDAGDAALRAQGRAMRDALLADLLAVPGLEVSYASDGAAPPPACEGARAARARCGESLFDQVRREAAGHDLCWIVAPESEGVLARLHEVATEAGGARWIGCDGEAIAIASSKCATLERLARHGITTPLAFAGATHWVVKPDDGAGAVATLRHASRAAALADLQCRHRAGEPATLEPWVEGEALSLSLLCGSGVAEVLAVNRQHIGLDADGRIHLTGVAVNVPVDATRTAALCELAAALGRALPGLGGYVGVDVVWHAARGPVAIEVNPRLTCSYVGLSAALRRNIAREVIAAHEQRFARERTADARA